MRIGTPSCTAYHWATLIAFYITLITSLLERPDFFFGKGMGVKGVLKLAPSKKRIFKNVQQNIQQYFFERIH